MKGWTPGAVYLCGLGYSTAIVILIGTWLVQTRAEWPTIRGTEPILSSWPNPTQPTEPRAVKAAPFWSLRSSVPRINSFGETGLVSAQGEAHNAKEASHEEVALFPMMPADMNLLQEKSTDGERVASAPKAINRAADRAFNSATRAPRLVGLVNAGRDLGAMRPSHLRVTLGRDRDFERESPTPYRITRSARPVRDGGGAAPSYTPQVALSRGVHHEPGLAASPGGRAGAYLRFARVAAHLCGVDEPILFEMISRESEWRQVGADGRTLRSRSGALGLTQIKASTARDVSPSLDPHDAAQNLIAGACYLRQQFDRFGSWRKALHAYHAGPWRRTTTRATLAYASDIITGSAN